MARRRWKFAQLLRRRSASTDAAVADEVDTDSEGADVDGADDDDDAEAEVVEEEDDEEDAWSD